MKLIKIIVSFIIYFSGLNYVFSKIYNRSHSKGLIILCYHNVMDFNNFKKQIDYFNKTYDIINSQKAYQLLNGDHRIKNKMVITFDDGYKSTYKIVKNITQNDIPFSVFLSTRYILNNELFWWDIINKISNKKSNKNKLIKKLKKIRQSERDKVINNIINNNEFDDIIYNQMESYAPLNIADINEMIKYNVEFGGHSHNHYIMPNTSEKLLLNDLKKNKNIIEEVTNKSCDFFVYPNNEYDETSITLLKNIGYKGALAGYNINNKNTNKYELGRIGINENDSKYIIKMKISGLWYFIKVFLGGFNNLMQHSHKKVNCDKEGVAVRKCC